MQRFIKNLRQFTSERRRVCAASCAGPPLRCAEVLKVWTVNRPERHQQTALLPSFGRAVISAALWPEGKRCESSDLDQVLPAVPSGQRATDGESNPAHKQAYHLSPVSRSCARVIRSLRPVPGTSWSGTGDAVPVAFENPLGNPANDGSRVLSLHGNNMPGQMHVQRDFDEGLIYRLRNGNRRSRNSIVVIHIGRQSVARVRPLSALMFANTALEPTATASLRFGLSDEDWMSLLHSQPGRQWPWLSFGPLGAERYVSKPVESCSGHSPCTWNLVVQRDVFALAR